MRRFKELLKNKSGSTLIEVIVSVLIVGIAFVPLMVGLNASLTNNRMNENKLYAEAVADNVIEVCKTYGANGLQSLSAASGNITAIFSDWNLTDKTAAEDPTKQKFEITGIDEGTREDYKAVIVFDPGAYNDFQNDYTNYRKIGNLDKAANVVFVDDSLNKIMNTFYTNYTNHGGSTSALSVKDFTDSCAAWLNREMIITVKENDEDASKCDVYKQIKYTAYPVGDNITIKTVTIPQGDLGSYTTEAKKIATYDAIPENVVVIYSPLKNIKGGKSEVILPVYQDIIKFDKQKEGGKINFYCLCERNGAVDFTAESAGLGVILSSDSTERDADGNYVISAYANVTTTVVGSVIELPSFGSGDDTSANNIMKDVTVYVYDNMNNEVMKKTSTVVEFQ